MKFRSIFFVLLLTAVLLLGNHQKVISQDNPTSDSILIESTLSGNTFLYHGEKIRPAKALELMENNDDAWEAMSKAQESYVFGNLFCIVGSGLLVYPIISSFFDAQPHWVVAGSGAGLILLSVPIFINFNRQSTQAVILYNSSLGMLPKTSMINHSLQFGITSSGFGVRFRF